MKARFALFLAWPLFACNGLVGDVLGPNDSAQNNQSGAPASPTASLVFSTPPRTTVTSNCSDIIRVVLEDASGAVVQAPATVNAKLTADVGTGFYTSPTCEVGTELTGLTIPAGESSAAFHISSLHIGTVDISVSAAGYGTTQQTETFAATTQTLAFLTAPQSLQVSECSKPVVVQLRDAAGQPVTSTGANPVALYASGLATFFQGPSCTLPTDHVLLLSGASEATFRFKAAAPGPLSVLTVLGLPDGLTSAQQNHTITQASARLSLSTAAQQVSVGVCSQAITLEMRDTGGVLIPVAAPTQVELTFSQVPVSYFSNASCTTAIQSVTLTPGSPSSTVFIRGTAAGTSVLRATAAGIGDGDLAFLVRPGAPSALWLANSHSSLNVNKCSWPVKVGFLDVYGNGTRPVTDTVIALSAWPTATFFSDATCTVGITSLQVEAGGASGTFYFKPSKVGTTTVNAQSTGLKGDGVDASVF